jgi:hypothetical protein
MKAGVESPKPTTAGPRSSLRYAGRAPRASCRAARGRGAIRGAVVAAGLRRRGLRAVAHGGGPPGRSARNRRRGADPRAGRSRAACPRRPRRSSRRGSAPRGDRPAGSSRAPRAASRFTSSSTRSALREGRSSRPRPRSRPGVARTRRGASVQARGAVSRPAHGRGRRRGPGHVRRSGPERPTPSAAAAEAAPTAFSPSRSSSAVGASGRPPHRRDGRPVRRSTAETSLAS